MNIRILPETVKQALDDEFADETGRGSFNPLFWSIWGGGAIWAAIIWWLV